MVSSCQRIHDYSSDTENPEKYIEGEKKTEGRRESDRGKERKIQREGEKKTEGRRERDRRKERKRQREGERETKGRRKTDRETEK